MSGTLSLTFNISSVDTDVTLPIVENPGDTITFTINWGDLTTPDSLLTHRYASTGIFTAGITITAGSVTRFGAANWQGVTILTAVATTSLTDWGLPGVTSFEDAFRTAALLTAVPTYVPSSVTNMQSMFRDAFIFNQDISGWDVSEVTNMRLMFPSANAFNRDISSWDVSKVTNMSSMFANNNAFNNGSTTNDGLHPLNWGSKTSLVETMLEMFGGATAFNQDVSGWNVSSVTDMRYMFFGAALFNNGATTDVGEAPITWTGTGISASNTMANMFYGAAKFNQDVSSWNVSNVTDMISMFQGAVLFNNGSTTNDASHALTWNAGTGTSNVLYMNNMFNGATAFNQDVSSWNVSNVTGMSYMFSGAYVFNQTISSWNVSSVRNMGGMFNNAFAFNNGSTTNDGLRPLTWTAGTGTSLVENMSNMFLSDYAAAFNQTISSWNVSSVMNMGGMFKGSTIFNNGAVGNIGGKPLTWSAGTGTSNVTDMNYMLKSTLFNQTISNWNVSKVVYMNGMFQTSPFNNGSTTNDGMHPLTWNAGTGTSLVENTEIMFGGCPLFNQDISTWNVSSMKYMNLMFLDCQLFNNGAVGNVGGKPLTWSAGTGTSFVRIINRMFEGCIAFNQDITGWNVSRVTDMSEMFRRATLFDQNIRYWVVVNPTNVANMFLDATAMAARYGETTGYGATPEYTFFNVEPPPPLLTLSLTFYVTGVEQEVILPISGTDVLVSVVWGDGATDTSLTHLYSTGTWTAIVTITGGSVTTFGSSGWSGVARLTGVATTSLTDWGLPGVSSFANAFNGASLLVSVPTYLPSSVRNVSNMFRSCAEFNQNISGWDVSLVTNMQGMFDDALFFNQNISTWNVSSVLNMILMFRNAINFDQNIRVWSVASPTTLTNMFSGATAMTSRYTGTAGYGATPLFSFFNLAPYPCFLEGTQILCLENGQEVYRPVQSLRKGDLVKTIYNGFLPVHMIGTSPMYNPNNNDRVASRLYRCPKENYPGLFEDLYITGCHSILVPWLSYEQGQKTIASLGKLYVTDKHCRLMAWVDEKAEPYKMAGVYNIYHIALENNDYYMNYGIYANGLLVESCSKRYLAEISNMRILGEEDCSLTEGVSAEENVFHKMPCLIESC